MPFDRLLRAFAYVFLIVIAFALSPALAESQSIRAGKLIDVERGRVLSDQLIRIEGARIVEVRPYAPGDAVSLDWSNLTVLPGLMDMHTHLVGDIQDSNASGPIVTTAAEDALVGVRNARQTLMAGFTTVRDVGCYRAFTDLALKRAIEKGTVLGPRMMVAGAYVTVPGGGGEVTGIANDVRVPDEMRRGVVRNPEETRAVVRDLLGGGADFIKLIATGAVLTPNTEPGELELSEAEMRAAVETATARGAHVTAHAHGAEGIKAAVRAGVRSIEHGSLIDEEGVRLMKARGAWLVADIYNGDYIEEIGVRDGWSPDIIRKNRETTDAQREGFRKAVRAGVRIAYGTDSGVYPHGDNAKQFAYMVRYGMTPMQAIQSATISAAQLMGWERDVGAIAPGRYADLVALPADPLADITALESIPYVMKGGELVKAPN